MQKLSQKDSTKNKLIYCKMQNIALQESVEVVVYLLHSNTYTTGDSFYLVTPRCIHNPLDLSPANMGVLFLSPMQKCNGDLPFMYLSKNHYI